MEEGRGVFDNLVKFITWILPTNPGQGLVIMVAVMLAQPLPLLPVQALEFCQTTVPDLLLGDYLMPVLNGISLVRQFRAIPGGVPIAGI